MQLISYFVIALGFITVFCLFYKNHKDKKRFKEMQEHPRYRHLQHNNISQAPIFILIICDDDQNTIDGQVIKQEEQNESRISRIPR